MGSQVIDEARRKNRFAEISLVEASSNMTAYTTATDVVESATSASQLERTLQCKR
jgi:hypothetical protein